MLFSGYELSSVAAKVPLCSLAWRLEGSEGERQCGPSHSPGFAASLFSGTSSLPQGLRCWQLHPRTPEVQDQGVWPSLPELRPLSRARSLPAVISYRSALSTRMLVPGLRAPVPCAHTHQPM